MPLPSVSFSLTSRRCRNDVQPDGNLASEGENCNQNFNATFSIFGTYTQVAHLLESTRLTMSLSMSSSSYCAGTRRGGQ